MRSSELVGLTRVLMYGQPGTRQQAAAELLRVGQRSDWARLADTLRSGADWHLRARCLEALGLVAGQAERETAETILDLVCGAFGATEDALEARNQDRD